MTFFFDIEKIKYEENNQIINKLNDVLKKPIKNFLVLLSKIDLSKNIKSDMKTLKGCIMKYFLPIDKDFNYSNNKLLPCSNLRLD